MSLTNDLSHGYINVITPDVHKNHLTERVMRECSEQYSKPVLFKRVVDLSERAMERPFYEVNLDERLSWREQRDIRPVGFRDKASEKITYEYASGQVGTAREFLDKIFVERANVYSHLGYISVGFNEMYTLPWGRTFFNHLRQEVFRAPWFAVDEWKLTGHCFLGQTKADFGSPEKGFPGSDWHMFCTLNVFVMVAGLKKWMTCPPSLGEQFERPEELLGATGGREAPRSVYDTVWVEPGDVLINVPYEWHCIHNRRGLSCGVAYRVIDWNDLRSPAWSLRFRKLQGISEQRIELARKRFQDPPPVLSDRVDEFAHFLTSARYASLDPRRMAMLLNWVEMAVLTSFMEKFTPEDENPTDP
jgi:hypothetical protein